MRLEADHTGIRSVVFSAFVLLVTAGSAACQKTWVLGPDPGLGGVGNMSTPAGGGRGGNGGPPGTGGGGHDDSGTGGRGDSGTGGRPPSCFNPSTLQINMVASDVVFVVGRNASMATKFGDTAGSTRMTAVQADVFQVAFDNQTAVNFGYQDFPAISGCGNGLTCCPSSIYHTPAVQMNAGSINAGLNHCDQSGSGTGCVADTDSRAVSQTLMVVNDLFLPTDDRSLVLIVDGPPGCPTEDPNKACMDALAQETPLTRMGIKTYVIGVGDEAQTDSCLQQMAQLGGTSTPLFGADDPTSLMKALTQIVAGPAAAACTIQLKGVVQDPTLVSVLVSNHEVHYDADPTGGDGWSYVPGSFVIELQGKACTYLQGHPGVTVRYGCPPCMTPSPTCL